MTNRATMSEQYTPTMWLVRARYCDSTARGEQDDAQALSVPREVHEKNHAEFDRWLAKRDAEVAAKAYERAILDVGLNPDLANQLLDTNPYRKAVKS